jgi:hypothetical protein
MAMNTSPDNHENRDPELMQRARALHEQACEHIDAGTRIKLAAARRSALAGESRHSRRVVWLPAAGAVAACALALGVVWFRPQPVDSSSARAGQAAAIDTELPLDADSQQLDLYQNLDFYQWLARQPRTHTGLRGGRQ